MPGPHVARRKGAIRSGLRMTDARGRSAAAPGQDIGGEPVAADGVDLMADLLSPKEPLIGAPEQLSAAGAGPGDRTGRGRRDPAPSGRRRRDAATQREEDLRRYRTYRPGERR